jgi:hypothetical protein
MGLIGLMAFGIFRLWGKRTVSSIGLALLVIFMLSLMRPTGGGDCGLTAAAWAKIYAAVSVPVASVVLIFHLVKKKRAKPR